MGHREASRVDHRASRGIGVYIAHAFARRGYNLTLVARSQSGLEQTKHLLKKSDV